MRAEPHRLDPPGEVVARWRHRPTRDVPGRARRAVAVLLRRSDLHGIDGDDLAVVLTELVTNAVEHARTPLTVTVSLHHGPGHVDGAGPVVRIEVADGSTAPPVPQPLDPWATRGRGLQMIDALATRWGHTAVAGGKTVWAELAPAPGPRG